MRTLLLATLVLLVSPVVAKTKGKDKKESTKTEPPKYVGCYKDSDPRDLPQKMHGDSVSSCIQKCADLKYRFAGVQFAYLCFCGNVHGRYGRLPESKCNSACREEGVTKCGGEWASSVYQTGYVPDRLKPKPFKGLSKREDIVMYDNIQTRQVPERDTFTLAESPMQYSSIPQSPEGLERVQRALDSGYSNNGNPYQSNMGMAGASSYGPNAVARDNVTAGQYVADTARSQYGTSTNAADNRGQYVSSARDNTNTYSGNSLSSNNGDSSVSSTGSSGSANYLSRDNSPAASSAVNVNTPGGYQNGTQATSTGTASQSTGQYQTGTRYPSQSDSRTSMAPQDNSYVPAQDASNVNKQDTSEMPSYQTQGQQQYNYPAQSPSYIAPASDAGAVTASSPQQTSPAEAVANQDANNTSYSVTPAQNATQWKAQDKKTPCRVERQMALKMTDSFIPSCTDDGDYAEVQCFEHQDFMKQCWCVDSNGHEQKGTRSYGGETPSCSNQADEQEETPCVKERKIALATYVNGIFVPECDQNGDFLPVQCYNNSNGRECWCVQRDGQEMRGTRQYNGTGPTCGETMPFAVMAPDCKVSPYGCCNDQVTPAKGPNLEGCNTTVSTPHSLCLQKQSSALSGAVDVFIPDCDPDGRFSAVQCYTYHAEGKTACWCVNQDSGEKINNTTLWERQPNCQVTAAPQPAVIICIVTTYGCCPDGATPAQGPNYQGCHLTTTVPPVTEPTTPRLTYPQSAAKEVCVTVLLNQVYYWQLNDKNGSYYQELTQRVENAVRAIYRRHPSYLGVRLTDVRAEQSPGHRSGDKAIAPFFVISFNHVIADPCSMLRDGIDQTKKLGPTGTFPGSLRDLGEPVTGCPPTDYKPVQPVNPVPPSYTTPEPTTGPNNPWSVPLPDQLAAHINFDNYQSGKVLDSSGHGNNAYMGNIEMERQTSGCGIVGHFIKGDLAFNGNTFSPKPSTAVTVSMWIKLNSISGRQSLFDTIASGQQQGNYHFEVVDGKIRWFHRNMEGTTVFEATTDGPVLEPNRWIHVAGTYDMNPGVAKLYVDNLLVNQTRGAGPLVQDWRDRVGIGNHKGARFVKGYVDEIYIYKAALNMDQINQLSCACVQRAPGVPSPQTGVWCVTPTTPSPTKATSKPTTEPGIEVTTPEPVTYPPFTTPIPCGPCITPPTCPPPCAPMTTPSPTTPLVTTEPPFTTEPTITYPPTTEPPTTEPPITTEAPTTEAPTTPPYTTEPPITTEAPTTEAPTTPPYTTEPPITTEAPTTEAPTTPPYTTEPPITTEAPTTEAPTTPPYTTEPPITTEATTTKAPTTPPYTTKPPITTEAPTTTPPTSPPPMNGSYTEWSEWSACTVTCGGGMRQRTRTCTNPSPGYNGTNCQSLGPEYEQEKCKKEPCPEDGGYGNWSTYGECSKTCAGGLQSRTRECNSPAPKYGGRTCERLGPANETRACNTFYCPIDGNYTEWSEYMVCSVTCGSGVQYQTRTCTNPSPQHGGKNCSSLGPSRMSRKCNTQMCPEDGGYTPYGNWSSCTHTCGRGTQMRTRTCTNPVPRYGGHDCAKDGPDYETKECNTQACPIDGAYTPYGNYSSCSKTCGGGTQTRMRSCTNPSPQYGGKNCTGPYNESRECNVQPCPIDGGFSEWGNYSSCSLTCGGGIQMRMRTCTNPMPANGGKPCTGDSTHSRVCSTSACPVDGGWGNWEQFGSCSVTCGGGNQQRKRVCSNPSPANGGNACEGSSHETRNCSTNPCPIEGGYTEWSEWSKCSVSCGGGEIKRTRNCSNPEPQYGGRNCSFLGPSEEVEQCKTESCPINGNYSQWSEWSPCTVTCGKGEHMRSRTCTNPPPQFGGKDCTWMGVSTETQHCNKQTCPVDGGYTEWSVWSICTVSCGTGYSYRTRNCSNPAPTNGGNVCVRIGKPSESKMCGIEPCPTEGPEVGWSVCSVTCGGGVSWRAVGKDKNKTRACSLNPCPVDGGYSSWSNWTQCSVSCGGGIRSRTRTCTSPVPLFGGKNCKENPVETDNCHMEACPAPKIPIRSCREFYERCHKKTDGVYTILIREKKTAREMRVYCDMSHFGGGWTLLVTSASNQGWNKDTLLMRNIDMPGLDTDYSILGEANNIKATATGKFLYRLEANERGAFGGIWEAPFSFSFLGTSPNLTVQQVTKFPPSWEYGPDSIGYRMPWLPPNDTKALLTTSDRKGSDYYGTIVSSTTTFRPSPWIMSKLPNPGFIWYWIKEASSMIKAPSEYESDEMCPTPVPGGYTMWGEWTTCSVTCGGAMQLRTRKCSNPVPLNGGSGCSGKDVETRNCNTYPCPGQPVNGQWGTWGAWGRCSVSCGGGEKVRTRKCNNPAPQNGGKTCAQQNLGSHLETSVCNTMPCPSSCNPPCNNGGTCNNGRCECQSGLYKGTYCQIAICKIPCENGGKCTDPVNNTCQCRPTWRGPNCARPVCTRYCMNGGTCAPNRTCTCLPGYSGRRCERCKCRHACMNGGTCVISSQRDKVGKCHCLPGYSGQSCQRVERCRLVKPTGPCLYELNSTVNSAPLSKMGSPCMMFLREVLSDCPSKSVTYTKELCEQQCDPKVTDACQKIWTPDKCVSTEVRSFFDPSSRSCHQTDFWGCNGNHNMYATPGQCKQICISESMGPNPTAVTPLAPHRYPPAATSYYWYFLAINRNHIMGGTGSPDLQVKGQYKLLDMGMVLEAGNYAVAEVFHEDALLDPGYPGLTVAIKFKVEGSSERGALSRYLVDTGAASLGTRGVSMFISGKTLTFLLKTRSQLFKVTTNIFVDKWIYVVATWAPGVGLHVYLNGQPVGACAEAQQVNEANINTGSPNFMVGKSLGSEASPCGDLFVSSLAIFKQNLPLKTVKKVYFYFMTYVVTPKRPQTHYLMLNVTNLSGKRVTLFAGDGMPHTGFGPIERNRIVLITKQTLWKVPITFRAFTSATVDSLSVNRLGKLVMEPTADKVVQYITITKKEKPKEYYLVIRVTNNVDSQITLKTSDNKPYGGFHIPKKRLANIVKRVQSTDPIKFTVTDDTTHKPLFVNFGHECFLTPTLTKKIPVSMSITKTAEHVTIFYLHCKITNLSKKDADVMFPDMEHVVVKARTVMKITKKVKTHDPQNIVVTTIDRQKALVIDNQPNLVLYPVEEKGGKFTTINITEKAIKQPSKPSALVVKVLLHNSLPRVVVVLCSDRKPAKGYLLPAGGDLLIEKTSNEALTFEAYDDVTKNPAKINMHSTAVVSPNTNGKIESLTITPKDEQAFIPGTRLESPLLVANFLAVNKGFIEGSLSFKLHGHYSLVDEGLLLDGSSCYLSTHIDAASPAEQLFIDPESADDGLSFGVKLYLDSTVTSPYDTPRFLLDTGVKTERKCGVSIYLLGENIVVEIATRYMSWKAETKMVKDRWFYLMITWASDKGIQIYLDGRQAANDRDGIAVDNREVSRLAENLDIGRNVGGQSTSYASFTIGSLALFPVRLAPSMVNQVSRYYIVHVVIQPKRYYINLRIHNKCDKEVKLQSDDAMPLEPVIIPARKVVYLKKEVAQPIPIVFTAYDDLGKESMVDNAYEYRVTPGANSRQILDVDVTEAKITANPAPKEQFYINCDIVNQRNSPVVIYSSDNHPAGGFVIGPGGMLSFSKTMTCDDNLELYARSSNELLNIGGFEKYSITPSRNSGHSQHLVIAADRNAGTVKETPPIPYSYYWSLDRVMGDYVPGSPSFQVNGKVASDDRSGIAFDGVTGWAGTTLSKSDCMVDLKHCPNGLSISVNLSIPTDALIYSEARYILDTGPSASEQGTSIYLIDGKLCCIVATEKKTWQVCTSAIPQHSFYMMVTWSPVGGLSLYVDNLLKDSNELGKPTAGQPVNPDEMNLCLGRNVHGTGASYYAHFTMRHLAIFYRAIEPQDRTQVYKYYSQTAPRARPEYYAVLVASNPTKHAMRVHPSNLPGIQFKINGNTSVKITIKTKNPSRLVFTAKDISTDKTAFMNGKSQFYVLPGESAINNKPVIISETAEYTPGPFEGEKYPDVFAEAPPFTPDHCFIFSELHGVAWEGLDVQGEIHRTEGGLDLDGSTTSLSGSLPSDDCLVQPEHYESFTILVKLKVDRSALTVNSPQYVMDTGRSAGKEGFSIYVLMKEIVVEMATNRMLYKGVIPIPGSNWFILTVTWGAKRGLSVYRNIEPVIQNQAGVSGMYPRNDLRSNFMLGRSIATQSNYVRASLGIFASFKQFLTEYDVKQAFAYFWGQGSGGEGNTKYVSLNVVNPLQERVTILSNNPMKSDGYTLPALARMHIMMERKDDNPVTFSVVESARGNDLYLSNKEFLRLTPTHSQKAAEVTVTTTGQKIPSPRYPEFKYGPAPVKARLAWNFNRADLKRKMVYGNHINLRLLGNAALAKRHEGIEFDGESTSLAGHVDATECVVNPDACQSGFSMVLEVKFHPDVMSYGNKRYVLDTSADGGNYLGLSLYVLQGKIVAVLVTKATIYKIQTAVHPDKVYFLGFTWKDDTGLKLYEAGRPIPDNKIQVTETATPSGYTVNTNEMNFCFGHAASLGGQSFAKVRIRLAALFNTYLASYLMHAEYLYFWTQGGGCETGVKMIEIKNLAGTQAVVHSDRYLPSGLTIAKDMKMTVSLEDQDQDDASITLWTDTGSADKKHPLYVNGLAQLSLGSELCGHIFHLNITNSPGGQGITQGTFHFYVKIPNGGKQDITLIDNNNTSRTVSSKTAKTFKISTSKAGPLILTAVITGTDQAVDLNNSRSVTIVPSKVEPKMPTLITLGKQRGTQGQNYMKVVMINRAKEDAIMTLGKQNVSVTSMFQKSIKMGTSSSDRIKVLAFSKSGHHLLINGKNAEEVQPQPNATEYRLTLTDTQATPSKKGGIPAAGISGKQSLYYITLKVKNEAGRNTVIAPSLDEMVHGFHVGAGPVLQITKEFTDNSPKRLMAYDAATNKPLIMNNRQSLLIRPAGFSDKPIPVAITQPTGNEEVAPMEHFVNLMLINKLSREVRVLPSKGKRGGYIVAPGSKLKVSVIIKGGPDVPEPISFYAEDVETESELELNAKLQRRYIKPSELPDDVYNFTITAPAPSVKPVHSWSMLSLNHNHIFGSPSLHAHGRFSWVDDGVAFNGVDTYMDTSLPIYDCLLGSDCYKGFSIGMKIRIAQDAATYDEPRYILDSGSIQKGGRGVSFYIQKGILYANVETPGKAWTCNMPLASAGAWSYYMMTWSDKEGIKLYRNAALKAASEEIEDRAGENTPADDEGENFVIGKRRGLSVLSSNAKFQLGSLTTFPACLNQSDVNKAFIFFSASMSAKIYYAPLRIDNEAGRDIIVKPDKGNPEGFSLLARSSMEVTLMSMSTQSTPIAPVAFHAYDAKSNASLEINSREKPFYVTPVETLKGFTTLIVTVPKPSVQPKYAWGIQKVVNGEVLDAFPAINAYGKLTEKEGGMLLDGKESWLDAGDFKGTCVSDPSLCQEGLSVGLKVRFGKEVSEYKHDPHYIMDSGGAHADARGVSMYIKNGKLYATVTEANSAWRVESPFKIEDWQYVLVTWKDDHGMNLYMDGVPVSSSQTLIPQEGEHVQDSLTHMAIGRSDDAPYGNTNMNIASLVFFDKYLSPVDASKASLFYWGGVKPSSADRYVKVKFDNRAGSTVKIVPSKGDNKEQGYLLSPLMTLQLSYVEKLPFNNIPVTFLAINPANNERLYINGRSGTLRVFPSSTKTNMTSAIVSSHFECPAMEGFFADPASNGRYIHCVANTPTIMTCPDKMTWQRDISSCAGEGRESSPELYFYNIKFNNYANTMAEVVKLSGNQQTTFVPIGKSLHMRFTSPSKDKAIFRAFNSKTGSGLELNNGSLVSLYPSQDPNRVTDVTVSDALSHSPYQLNADQTSTESSICQLPNDPGPCFHEVFDAASRASRSNRSEACNKYITEMLQSCTSNNGSFTRDQCSSVCDPAIDNICDRMWQSYKCTSHLPKYSFYKETGLCQPLAYNGCLGNFNKFDTEADCLRTCGRKRKRRTLIHNSNLLSKLKLPQKHHHMGRQIT